MDNLKEAIAGEGHEFQEMYPAFLEQARKEENKPAIFSIKNAMAVEEIHYSLYSRALEFVKEGKDMDSAKVYVCTVCGNTVESDIPESCPICNVPANKFIEIS